MKWEDALAAEEASVRLRAAIQKRQVTLDSQTNQHPTVDYSEQPRAEGAPDASTQEANRTD